MIDTTPSGHMIDMPRRRAIAISTVLAGSLLALATFQSEATAAGTDSSFVWFEAPLPNATYPEAPASIDVELSVYQGIDDAGVTSVELYLDQTLIGSMPCTETCSFPGVEVEQGAHTLEVISDLGSRYQVTIYVDEDPTSDTDTGSESDSDSGSSTDGDGSGGCSVASSKRPPWGLFALPALFFLPGLRRRNAQTLH